MSGVGNIQISPVNVLWQQVASESIDFAGRTIANAKGLYFDISTAKDAILHRVWMDDGIETAPSAGGRTLIAVDISSATTEALIATAVASALEALPGYISTSAGSVVTVKRTSVGAVTLTVQGTLTLVIATLKIGKDYNLGLLQGDLEVNIQPATFTVQAHQFGVTPLASLFQGYETIECTTTLLETQKSQLKELYSLYGGAFTPAAGTEIFGAGSLKQGQNLLNEGARLVLKPVNAVDETNNTVIMLAIPIPGALIFSGENPRTLAVTWQGFIDPSFDSRANALAFGDVFQEGAI